MRLPQNIKPVDIASTGLVVYIQTHMACVCVSRRDHIL